MIWMYKILIVDDSSFMRKIIKDILSKNGFDKLIEAKNGIDAIDLYKSEKPNLVILDVIMPDKDGFSTLTDIIEIDKKANIIVCSASSNNILVNNSPPKSRRTWKGLLLNEVSLKNEVTFFYRESRISSPVTVSVKIENYR